MIIETKYNIGETVYFLMDMNTDERAVCCECLGNGRLQVVFQEVQTNVRCPFCEYNNSTIYLKDYFVKSCVINKIAVDIHDSQDSQDRRINYYISFDDRGTTRRAEAFLFATKELAELQAVEIKQQNMKEGYILVT